MMPGGRLENVQKVCKRDSPFCTFSSSGYESATAESTNEKVIGMWDDCINEVDSYTTLDGGTVKTSMYNDVVAQSGDEFFVGSSTSDVPAGFTELSKSY